MFKPETEVANMSTDDIFAKALGRFLILKIKGKMTPEEAMEMAATEMGVDRDALAKYVASLPEKMDKRNKEEAVRVQERVRGIRRIGRRHTAEEVKRYQESRPDLFD